MDNFAKKQEFPKQKRIAEGFPFASLPVSASAVTLRHNALRGLIGFSVFKVIVMGRMLSSPQDAEVLNPRTCERGLI